MIRLFFLINAICGTISLNAQGTDVTFLGFNHPICSDSLHNKYSYINYSAGSNLYGYKIFRNDTLILDKVPNGVGVYNCDKLIFINDSTGFLVEYNYLSGTLVYKTANFGTTWKNVGSGYPVYLGIYIVNEHSGYLLTSLNHLVVLNRVSDISAAQILLDNSVTSSVTIPDTIFGDPLCPISSITAVVSNPQKDTVDYTITFQTVLSGLNSVNTTHVPAVFPNPAKNSINVQADQHILEISITGIRGNILFQEQPMNSVSTNLDISSLLKGIYFLQMKTEHNLYVTELIKD